MKIDSQRSIATILGLIVIGFMGYTVASIIEIQFPILAGLVLALAVYWSSASRVSEK